MFNKKTLVTAKNLNDAFISKIDTNSQTIQSNLSIGGGQLSLKNSLITDNANNSYMRIDPQGNTVIVYDGVNNQELRVYSSSGSEAVSVQTINGSPSYGLIDVLGVDHLKIMGNSAKPVKFGGNIEANAISSNTGLIQSTNPLNASANFTMSWINNDPRLRIGGGGSGSSGTFRVQGVADIDRFTSDSAGNFAVAGLLTVSGNQLLLKGGGVSSTKIDLYPDSSGKYVIGLEASYIDYGNGTTGTSNIGHKFYARNGELIAQIGVGGNLNSDRLNSQFNGNLGISGYASIGTSSVNSTRALTVQQSNANENTGVAILAGGSGNVGGYLWAGTGGFVIDSRANDYTGAKGIYIRTGGNEALFIGANRYIGMGTTNPAYPLDVVGAMRTQGNGSSGAHSITDTSSGRTWSFGVWGNRLEFFSLSGSAYSWAQLTSEAGKWRFGGYASTTGQLLQVAGDAWIQTNLTVDGTTTVNGTAINNGTTKINNNIIMGSSSFKHHKNLISYSNNASSATGAFVIEMPFGFVSTMSYVKVKGYFYDVTSPFELTVGFYPYSVGQVFNYTGYINIGSNKLNVRMARRVSTGNIVLILGDENASYPYPKIIVTDFIQGYQNINDSYGTGWTISQLTDVTTDFDKMTTVPDKSGFWHSGNDGAGSGLDADLLDGLQSSQFLRSDQSGTLTGALTVSSSSNPAIELRSTGGGTPFIDFSNDSSIDFDARIILTGDDVLDIQGVGTNGFKVSGYMVWHSGNMGSGSGMNADLLDGIDSSQFLRSDTSDTMSGNLTISNTAPQLIFSEADTSKTYILVVDGSNFTLRKNNTGTTPYIFEYVDSSNTFNILGNKAWTAGNDGAGSGLDADTVDGLQASQFLRSDVDATLSGSLHANTIYLEPQDAVNEGGEVVLKPSGSFSGNAHIDRYQDQIRLWVDGGNSLTLNKSGDATWGGYKLWHQNNDGSGSGLDADLLDGIDSSQFVRSDINDTITSKLTLTDSSPLIGTVSGSQYITIMKQSNGGNTGIFWNESTKDFMFYYGSVPQAVVDSTGQMWYGNKTNKYWHQGNDGAGSGLDADLLDGLDSTKFVRTDTSSTISGTLTFEDSTERQIKGSSLNAGFYINSGNLGSYDWKNSKSIFSYSQATNTLNLSAPTVNIQGYKAWHQGNDGSGSGLDADLLDGLDSSQFLRSDSDTISTAKLWVHQQYNVGSTPLLSLTIGDRDTGINWVSDGIMDIYADNTVLARLGKGGLWDFKLNPTANGYKIWHSGNMGAGSGLDSDKLDGLDSTQFLRSDANTTTTGSLTVGGTIVINPQDSVNEGGELQLKPSGGYSGNAHFDRYQDTMRFWMDGGSSLLIPKSGDITWGGNKVWHAGNDGAGSGLDADKFDGLDSTQFLRSDIDDGMSGLLSINRSGDGIELLKFNTERPWSFYQKDTGAISKLDLRPSGDGKSFRITTPSGSVLFEAYASDLATSYVNIMGYKAWHAGNMGAGSGLDADKIDGLQSSQLVRNDQDNTINGNLTLSGTLTVATGGVLFPNNPWGGSGDSAKMYLRKYQGTEDQELVIEVQNDVNDRVNIVSNGNSSLVVNGNTVWNAGNHGSGSGLDADKLDGLQSTQFLRSDVDTSLNGLMTITRGSYTLQLKAGGTADHVYMEMYADSQNQNARSGWFGYGGAGTNNMTIANQMSGNIDISTINGYYLTTNGNKVWHAGNDGTGSGLDADTLDGVQATSFVRNDSNQTINGQLTLNPVSGNWTIASFDNGASNNTNRLDLRWTPAYDRAYFVPYDENTSQYGREFSYSFANNRWEFDIDTVINGYKIWHSGNMGTGSYLDADKVDGLQASQFLRSDVSTSLTGNLTINYGGLTNPTGRALNIRHADGGGNAWAEIWSDDSKIAGLLLGNPTDGWKGRLDYNASTQETSLYAGGTRLLVMNDSISGLSWKGYKIWHSGNMGSGSGLDADKVDGIQASQFMRNDTSNSLNGNITFTGSGNSINFTVDASDTAKIFTEYGGSISKLVMYMSDDTNDEIVHRVRSYSDAADRDVVRVGYGYVTIDSNASLKVGSNVVWHQGNDGSGSGLDADLLDGIQASQFMRNDANTSTTGTLSIGSSNPSILANQSDGSLRITNSSGYIEISPKNISYAHIYTDRPSFYFNKPLLMSGNTVWHAGNDGAGSGLDADKIDGLDSSQFMRNDIDTQTVGNIVVNKDAPRIVLDRPLGATNSYSGFLAREQGVTKSYWLYNHNTDNWVMYNNGEKFIIDNTGQPFVGSNVIWHSGNDGANSGLDADLLDGNHKDWIRDWNNLLNKPTTFTPSFHDHSGNVLKNDDWEFGAVSGYGNHNTGLARMSQMINMALSSAHGADVFRFKAITDVQYISGTSWLTWNTSSWQNILDGTPNSSWDVGATQKKFRFTVDMGSDYVRPSSYLVYQKYLGGELDYTLTVDKSVDKVTWTNVLTTATVGNKALNLFASGTGDIGQPRYFRFTFDTQATDANQFSLVNLMGFTHRREFVINGTGMPIYWNYSQNIGLGNITPTEKLHVNGNIFADGGRLILGHSGQSDWSIHSDVEAFSIREKESSDKEYFRIEDGGGSMYLKPNGVNALTLDSSGKVGFMTATPTASVDIQSGYGADKGIQLMTVNIDTVSSGNVAIRNLNQLRLGSTDDWDWNSWAGIKYDTPSTTLIIGGPASSKFSSNANPPSIDVVFDGIHGMSVGKSTAPTEMLDVNGNIKAAINKSIYIGDSDAITGARLRFIHSGANAYIDFATGNMYFRNTGTVAMTLTSTNRLGIGTSAPSADLDVNGSVNYSGLLQSTISNSAALQLGSYASIWNINTANTIGVYGVSNTAVGAIKLGSTGPTLYGSGNSLGIGTTSPDPAMALHVNGSIKLASGKGIWSGYNNAYILNDHGNGNVTLSAAGSQLYLGYQNTTLVRLSSNLYATNGTTLIADTAGALYYKGQDADARYLNVTKSGTIATVSNDINMANNDIISANSLSFSDPGPGEGISWLGGSLWKIYESPDDLSNGAGNLQIVQNATRRMAVNTDGSVWVGGTITANAIRLVAGGDLSPTSTGHAFTVGNDTTGYAVKIDNNEIGATYNGVTSALHINNDGGNVTINAANTARRVVFDVGGTATITDYNVIIDRATATTGKHITLNEAGNAKWNIESNNGTFRLLDSGNALRMSIDQSGIAKIGSERIQTTWDSTDTNNGYKTISTSGWYRIATNDGTRANAKFTLLDIAAGKHHAVTFYAGVAYNTASRIAVNVLSNVFAGSSATFGGVRVLTNTTYDTQYLEVYINATGSVRMLIEENEWNNGWTPVNFTSVGTNPPTGYSSKVCNFDGENAFGEMSVNGNTVWHGGNMIVSTNAPSGTPKTGTVWIQY